MTEEATEQTQFLKCRHLFQMHVLANLQDLFYFILFFIHFSVEQDVLIVDSVPLTVTLWWLSNGISGTINEKFPWRPAVLTWRPRESTQNPPLCS